MARFDDWLTDPAVTLAELRPWLRDPTTIGSLYRGKYLVYTTSGTTGDPAVLVQDRRALSLYLASRVRMYPVILDREVLTRIARGRGRSAALLADRAGTTAVWSWPNGRGACHPLGRNLQMFSVSAPLAETVAGLNWLQPVIVSGYASAITLLAEEAAAGRLAIDPALVFSIAEGLTPDARDRIGAVWNTRLIEGYGASEAPVIAFGCRRRQPASERRLGDARAGRRAVPSGARRDAVAHGADHQPRQPRATDHPLRPRRQRDRRLPSPVPAAIPCR